MLANALTGVRLALTVPFLAACAAAVPTADAAIRTIPVVLFVVVAGSDFFDGWIARQRGTASGRGQLFDHAADVLFIGSSLIFFALLGRVSWWVPLAVAGSVATYARVLWRETRGVAGPQMARTALGHAAGVVNYAMVGLVATDFGLPEAVPEWLIHAAGGATAGINLLAVVGRLRPSSRALVTDR